MYIYYSTTYLFQLIGLFFSDITFHCVFDSFFFFPFLFLKIVMYIMEAMENVHVHDLQQQLNQQQEVRMVGGIAVDRGS